MTVNGMVSSIAANLLKNASDVNEVTARLVLNAHQKINRILGYESSEKTSVVNERIRMSLMQPVEEQKYDKGVSVVEDSPRFSLRLIVVLSLGVIAIVLLIVLLIRFRKH